MKKLILLSVPLLLTGCLVLSFGDNVFHSPKPKKAEGCCYEAGTATITTHTCTDTAPLEPVLEAPVKGAEPLETSDKSK